MTHLRRLVPLLGVLLVLTTALPSFAASHAEDDDGQGTESVSTTDEPVQISEPEVISGADSPAVVIPELEVEEFEQPWTARYLIPFLVVSAVFILAVVVITYNRSVRHRYKVVA